MVTADDLRFMTEALKEAEKALLLGEVPVGAVAVWDGEIVGRGHNMRETAKNAMAHAELIAMDGACRRLGGWRLWKCTLYVTLEPCPMCAGAIMNARVKRLVFGAPDPKYGACGGAVNLFALPGAYSPEVVPGILPAEASGMLSYFFRELRRGKSSGAPDD